MCFTPTLEYRIIVQSPSFVCMYVVFFYLAYTKLYKICSLTNARILPVDCLSENVRLSVLFTNSPLHIYFILYNHLVSKKKETLFEFSIDRQHWNHSICDKSLSNFDVLKLFFLPFFSCRNWQQFNSLFSSVHHSFHRKTLDTIVVIYFFRNSHVRLLILANVLLKIKSWKYKTLTIELVTRSENILFLNFDLVTRKQKNKS